jgi:hypothetical protein
MVIKMENSKRIRANKVKTRTNSKKSDVLENIIEEYCLKRNSFNPTHPSPNVFIGKLQVRMRQYYNNLYKDINRFTE